MFKPSLSFKYSVTGSFFGLVVSFHFPFSDFIQHPYNHVSTASLHISIRSGVLCLQPLGQESTFINADLCDCYGFLHVFHKECIKVWHSCRLSNIWYSYGRPLHLSNLLYCVFRHFSLLLQMTVSRICVP